MLGVHEGRHAAQLLRLGHHLQGQRGLARRFRAVDLDHATAGKTANTKGVVDADCAARDRVRLRRAGPLSQTHDGALAELLLDLAYSQFDGFRFFLVLVRSHEPCPFDRWGGGNAPTRLHTRNAPSESQAQKCVSIVN